MTTTPPQFAKGGIGWSVHGESGKPLCSNIPCEDPIFSRHLFCRKCHFTLPPTAREALWKSSQRVDELVGSTLVRYDDARQAAATIIQVIQGDIVPYETLVGDTLYQHTQSTTCAQCVQMVHHTVIKRLTVTLLFCLDCGTLSVPVLKGQFPLPGLEAAL